MKSGPAILCHGRISVRWMLPLWVAALVVLFQGAVARADESPGRRLAPGVLQVIPPATANADTVTGPAEIIELSSISAPWTPALSPDTATLSYLVRNTYFRRSIWGLEFAFKPLRIARVKATQADGSTSNQLVWYLLYRVRNLGRHLRPGGAEDQFGHQVVRLEEVNHGVRFFPMFILETHDTPKANPNELIVEGSDRVIGNTKAYTDLVLPAAVRQIHASEIRDPRIRLHNSVDISRVSIPVSTEQEDHAVWGVATWEGVTARADFVTVYAQGLTNAFRWRDAEGVYQAGDPPGTGRDFAVKTLQLNFWRPGDQFDEHTGEFRFGMPNFKNPGRQAMMLKAYGMEKPRDFGWVFRP